MNTAEVMSVVNEMRDAGVQAMQDWGYSGHQWTVIRQVAAEMGRDDLAEVAGDMAVLAYEAEDAE